MMRSASKIVEPTWLYEGPSLDIRGLTLLRGAAQMMGAAWHASLQVGFEYRTTFGTGEWVETEVFDRFAANGASEDPIDCSGFAEVRLVVLVASGATVATTSLRLSLSATDGKA